MLSALPRIHARCSLSSDTRFSHCSSGSLARPFDLAALLREPAHGPTVTYITIWAKAQSPALRALRDNFRLDRDSGANLHKCVTNELRGWSTTLSWSRCGFILGSVTTNHLRSQLSRPLSRPPAISTFVTPPSYLDLCHAPAHLRPHANRGIISVLGTTPKNEKRKRCLSAQRSLFHSVLHSRRLFDCAAHSLVLGVVG
jgi:hypothetical protein